MKKLLYAVFILLAVISVTSCEEEDQNPDLSGEWKYREPHFKFGYAEDTVRIAMGRESMKIAVEDLKTSFSVLADQKMGEYFEGLNFGDNHQMEIRMRMGDQTKSALHACYEQSGDYIQVELDSTEMKMLTNGAVSQIPVISFSYIISNNELQMYFNKNYIQVVYLMMSDKLMDMLIANVMHQNPATFPAPAKEAIKAELDQVLRNITQLEIGFKLSRFQQ